MKDLEQIARETAFKCVRKEKHYIEQRFLEALQRVRIEDEELINHEREQKELSRERLAAAEDALKRVEQQTASRVRKETLLEMATQFDRDAESITKAGCFGKFNDGEMSAYEDAAEYLRKVAAQGEPSGEESK